MSRWSQSPDGCWRLQAAPGGGSRIKGAGWRVRCRGLWGLLGLQSMYCAGRSAPPQVITQVRLYNQLAGRACCQPGSRRQGAPHAPGRVPRILRMLRISVDRLLG
jgi:hypothetical protein